MCLYVIGYCLPPDTLKNICTQIHVESTLYTLVRGTQSLKILATYLREDDDEDDDDNVVNLP